MRAEKVCCVPNCGVTNEILHKFPNPDTEPDRFSDWIFKVGGDIFNKDNLYIYMYRRVCHLHFEDKYRTHSKRLIHNAVPTLKLSDAAPAPDSVSQQTARECLKNSPETQVTNLPNSMDEGHHTEDSLSNANHVEIITEEKPIIFTFIDLKDKVDFEEINIKPKSQLNKRQTTTCRTCLQRCHPKYTISVFTIDKTTGWSFNHMMHSTTGIKAVENDKFPTRLCRTCKQAVMKCYNFQMQAKRANSILQSKSRSNDGRAGVTARHAVKNKRLESETDFMDYDQCDSSDFGKTYTNSKADVKVKPESHRCTACGCKFSSTETLAYHSRSCREKPKPKLVPNQCRRCAKSFSTASALLQHIGNHHRNLISNKTLHNKRNQATYAVKAKQKIGEVKSGAVSMKHVTSASARAPAPRTSQSAPKPKKSSEEVQAERAPVARDGERCNVCSEIFPTTDSLNEHCSGHGETEVIMCGLCERVYLKYSQFKRHFTVHHPEMDIINQTENTESIVEIKDAAAMEQVLRHVRLTSIGDLITANLPPSDDPVVIDAFVHTCGLCGRLIFSLEEVELHNQTEHADCAERCCYCAMHFRNSEYLSSHQNHCKNTPMKYECPPCGQRFYSERGLYKHVANEHGDQYQVWREGRRVKVEEDAEEKRQNTCETCGMAFKLRTSLTRHRKLSSCCGEPATVPCDRCAKVFRSRPALRKHVVVVHHGTRPVHRHLCALCGKTFARKNQLIIHVRTHTGETPFACPVCKKGFKTDHELKYHQWRHNGTRRYKCEQCGKGFPRNGSLQRHLMMHTGERPYKCNMCEAAFIQKHCLVTHLRKHYNYDESLALNLEPFKNVESSDSPTAAKGISRPGHNRSEGVVSLKRLKTATMKVRSVSSSQKNSKSNRKGKSNPLILYDSDD